MKTEISAIVRPKGKVVQKNFSLNVLNGSLKGKKLYCLDVLGATISFDKFKQMVKSKLRSMGLSAEISLELFWGNDRIECELDFFEMWIFGVEDEGGFITLHVDINGGGGGGVDMDTGDGVGVDMAVSRRGVSIKNLDDGVLENILFRLPLGTASSQAKRVCRLWKTILSNRRHNEVGFLFVCYDYKDDLKDSKLQLCFGEEYDRIDCNRMNYYYSHETVMVMEHCRFGFEFSPHYDILVGSCKGLVCFQKKVPGGQCLREPFAVCNPLTGEFISLKANLGRDVVDGATRLVSSGFGYCHSTGEYKVVRLYSTSQEWRVTYTQVYTIGSNKWRDMETLLTDRTLSTESGPGVFANGSLHWLVTNQEERLIILVLDLEDEKFGQLPLPPSEAYEDHDYNELKLLGGNLCWFKKTWSRIEIWSYTKDILNTKNTRWKWDFSLLCNGLQFQPFAVTKSHQILMLGERYLYCYDPETRTVSSRLKYMDMDRVIPQTNSYNSLKDYGETWYGPGC